VSVGGIRVGAVVGADVDSAVGGLAAGAGVAPQAASVSTIKRLIRVILILVFMVLLL
jgi:hypothetical protein